MREKVKDGYVRVTSLISMIPDVVGYEENGLRPLFDFSMKRVPQAVLDRKRAVGVNVHERIHFEYLDEFKPLTDEENGYFQSYYNWANAVKLNIDQSEVRLYDDELKITGCLDVLGSTSPDKKLQIIDFKCSSNAHPKKWALQAAFYYILARENGMGAHREVLFVKLDKGGGMPQVYKYEILDNEIELALSLHKMFFFVCEKMQHLYNAC